MDLIYRLALKYVRWTEMITWGELCIYICFISLFYEFLIEIDIPVDQFGLYSRASFKALKHVRGS